jgi:hypothetical protein
MDAINTMRAVLVGGAGMAAIVAAFFGWWLTTVILAVGIVLHVALWVHLHRRAASTLTQPVE